MQPLDTSVFGQLKTHWQDVCQCVLRMNVPMNSFVQRHSGRLITKYSFSSLLAEAWSNTITVKAILNGFKHCGVYPFDRQIVLKWAVLKSHSTTTASGNVS